MNARLYFRIIIDKKEKEKEKEFLFRVGKEVKFVWGYEVEPDTLY